jgi:predicted nucleic acid-binding protein
LALMYLVDTNIFLEILLEQDKSEACKTFLSGHINELAISDFSLHSIGVILFRHKAHDVFSKFIGDILPHLSLLSLPKDQYQKIIPNQRRYTINCFLLLKAEKNAEES